MGYATDSSPLGSAILSVRNQELETVLRGGFLLFGGCSHSWREHSLIGFGTK